MTDLIPHHFHNHTLRIFPTDDNLSFWTVAKDVTDILGYREAKDGLRLVPDHHKGRHSVPTLGGIQEMLCVDESGLYRLILRSNKPEAEPFMEWVTGEVLPAIRRNGQYSAAQSQNITELVDTQRRLIAAQEDQITGARSQAAALVAEKDERIRVLNGELEYLEDKLRRVERALGPVTDDERVEIVTLRQTGRNYAEISRQTYRSQYTIARVCRQWAREHGGLPA